MFNTIGLVGGPGKVLGSGVLWMTELDTEALFSTVKDADQEVSPLSDEAVQVYRPESDT